MLKKFSPDAYSNWQLTITNAAYLSYPRALGFKPVGSGGVVTSEAWHRVS